MNPFKVLEKQEQFKSKMNTKKGILNVRGKILIDLIQNKQMYQWFRFDFLKSKQRRQIVSHTYQEGNRSPI